MRLTCLIIGGLKAAGCCRIEYYTKLEEKKDWLCVYKLTDEDGLKKDYEGIRGFECPLCYNFESRNEIKKQFEESKKRGFPRLSECYSNYNYNVEREDCADVFEVLENCYNEIQDIKANYDESCYFKYTCPQKNTDIYIIFEVHPKEKINSLHFKFKDERYQYERWKNDENLKKNFAWRKEKDNRSIWKKTKARKNKSRIKYKKNSIKKTMEWNEFQKRISELSQMYR